MPYHTTLHHTILSYTKQHDLTLYYRVMETFQDLADYNENSVARSRQAILSTQQHGNIPATVRTVATLDSRDAVGERGGERGERGGVGGFRGQDHDYLIETERNMEHINDQFMRFTPVVVHDLNVNNINVSEIERERERHRDGERDSNHISSSGQSEIVNAI